MLSLKKIPFLALVPLSFTTLFLDGEEPVCHRCEEIREYNAKYHQNFEYYDDYQKTQEGKTQSTEVNSTAKPLQKASTTQPPSQPAEKPRLPKLS